MMQHTPKQSSDPMNNKAVIGSVSVLVKQLNSGGKVLDYSEIIFTGIPS